MGEEQILGDAGTDETGAAEESKDTSILTDDESGESKDDAGDVKAGEDADHEKDGDTDEKSEDGKADEGKDGAPEQYQDFKLPDGFEIDKADLAELTPLLQEVGATQEQAQHLIDLQTKVMQKASDAQQKVWADTQSDWRDTAQNDEEYGKGKYNESVGLARKAVREIGGAGLSKALDETGMGNHPEFIRFFYRVGKAIGEDSFSFGSANQEGAKTHAERIFPNQGKK